MKIFFTNFFYFIKKANKNRKLSMQKRKHKSSEE